jgi:hypothetical protein
MIHSTRCTNVNDETVTLDTVHLTTHHYSKAKTKQQEQLNLDIQRNSCSYNVATNTAKPKLKWHFRLHKTIYQRHVHSPLCKIRVKYHHNVIIFLDI